MPMNEVALGWSWKLKRCRGLVPWRFTLAAMGKAAESSEMPWPCAVEVHVSCYYKSRGILRRCHGLVPWRFTFAALPTS